MVIVLQKKGGGKRDNKSLLFEKRFKVSQIVFKTG